VSDPSTAATLHAPRERSEHDEQSDAAALLQAVAGIDGFRHACLVDPGSGTVLDVLPGATADVDGLGAGAADLLDVLTMMGARLALHGEVDDLVVTTTAEHVLVRVVEPGPRETRLLVVALDRRHSRLALALRQTRDAGRGAGTADGV
jgi:hypothetical protein